MIIYEICTCSIINYNFIWKFFSPSVSLLVLMRKVRVWILFIVVLLWNVVSTIQQSGSGQNPITGARGNKTTLKILLIAPFPDERFDIPYDDGHSLIPGGLLAIEQINNSSEILPDYQLEPVIIDGGCTVVEKAVMGILSTLVHRDRHQDDSVLGIVGPVCSEATATLSAQLGQSRIRVPLVALATSPILTNRKLYQYTFGAVSSSAEYTLAGIKVFKEKQKRKQWDQLAVLYAAERPYNLNTFLKFEEQVKINFPEDIFSKILMEPLFPYYIPLENVIKRGIRIIFVYASKCPACWLMCRAYHLGMFYPKYQFLFTDRRLRNFEDCNKEPLCTQFYYDYNCSVEQIKKVVSGSILFYFNVNSLQLESSNTKSESGFLFHEIEKLYKESVTGYSARYNVSAGTSVWAYPFYDAVWALALAANKVLPNLTLDSQLHIWENKQLLDAMYGLNFQGVSTRIKFNRQSGFTQSVLDIFQVTEMKERLIGHYNAGKLITATCNNQTDCVDDLLSNIIASSFEMSTEVIPQWLSTLGYFFSVLILLVTLLYHIIHIAGRKRHSIKASSPKLNHFIFLGCYLVVGSVILSTTTVGVSISSTAIFKALCYIEVWLRNIGVTLVFSTLFGKYYRLYLVFIRTYDHRINLSNGILSIIVIVLVFVDIVLLTIGTSFEPFAVHMNQYLDNSVNPPVNRVRRICVVTSAGMWFSGATLSYICLLCLAVVALSVINRRIKQKDFNTTTTTNILVYLYSLLLGILIPIAHTTEFFENTEVKFGVNSLVYLIFTVLCLVFLFTPPLIILGKEEYLMCSQNHSLSVSLRIPSNILVTGKFDQKT